MSKLFDYLVRWRALVSEAQAQVETILKDTSREEPIDKSNNRLKKSP